MTSGAEDIELPFLPGLLDCDYDFTFDYGGSVIKVIYKKKTQSGEEKLYLKSLSGGNHDELFTLASGLGKQGGRDLSVTGVGCKQFSSQLQKGLHVKFDVVPEFECLVKAFHLLTEHLKYPDMFCEIPRDSFVRALKVTRGFAQMIQGLESSDTTNSVKFTNDDGTGMFSQDFMKHSDEDIIKNYHSEHHKDLDALFPCVIVVCGSGFAFYKMMSRDGQAEMTGYSPRGGRTLLGLGSLLTGAQSFEELVALAAQGDSANVDQFAKSLKGGDSDKFYDPMPNDALCFCFGHAFKNSIDCFKKEDLAAAVVQLICTDVAQFSISIAQAASCKNVIFCGSILNHPIVTSSLSEFFLGNALSLPPQMQPRLHMCTLGEDLGALGVWTIAAEAQAKRKAENKDADS